jgi:heme exporter protein A
MIQRQVFSALTLTTNNLLCGRGGLEFGGPQSFSLSNGQCILLRGPNGTGKSTLLLTLAGIIPRLGGDFSFSDQDPDDGPFLHYCGHRNAIKPRLSVQENLSFWSDVNGAYGFSVQEALERVGLATLSQLDAGYLSAGQSRRLALARLLVSPRALWLLDEPTAALDVNGHSLVTQLLNEHLAQGGLAIAATHDPIALAEPCRVIALALETKP